MKSSLKRLYHQKHCCNTSGTYCEGLYNCKHALTQAVMATEGDSDMILSTLGYNLTYPKQLTSLREVQNVVSQNDVSDV
jgi:hypothetical protein